MEEINGHTLWRWYKDSLAYSKDWREELRTNYDMYASKQWSSQEEAYLKSKGRQKITMNKTSPTIDSILGNQINNRQEVSFTPVEEGDLKTSTVLNGAYEWLERKCFGAFEVTDAFNDMLLGGIGWTLSRMDYDTDPEGMLITAERISPLECAYDPQAIRRNLNDTRYRQTWQWLPYEDAVAQWPEIKNINIKSLPQDEIPTAISVNPRDDYNTSRYRLVYERAKDMIQVMQTQYWRMEPEYLAIDPDSGKEITLTSAKARAIKLFDSGIPYMPRKVRKYHQAFSVGNVIVENQVLPVNMFTLLAMTWKRDENDSQFYGLLRQMRDPQRWANKFLSDIQDMMTTSRKGGAFVEESATKDARRFEEDFARPGGILWLKEGGLGKIQERAMGDYPQGVDRLMQLCLHSIPDVSGVNLEMLGLADRQQAGIVEAQRKQSAYAIVAPAFDALTRHTQERAAVCLEYIIKFMSDGRLVRVLGENGRGQYVPLIKEEGVSKFDIFVDEAPRSQNVKEMVLAFLEVFTPMLLQQGINILPDVVDYLPLPETIIEKLKQKFQPQQPDPAQQKMQELQMQNAEAEVDAKRAQAEKARSDAQSGQIKAMSSILS